MNWGETLRSGLEAVVTHRMRSLLTVLGMLIGVAAVVLTVGLGEGAQQQVSQQIEGLGTDLLVVTPGSSTTGGVRGGSGTASTLTPSDAAALTAPGVAPDVSAAAPVVSGQVALVAGSGAGQTSWTTSVTGTTPAWATVRNRTLAEGTFLTDADVSGATSVVVLGATTASELFGSADPLGQTVLAGDEPLTVVGVLAPSGSSGGTTQDDLAVVPLSTAQERVLGGTSRTSLSSIAVSARSSAALSAAYQEVDDELLALHGTDTPADADFTITSQQSLLTTATSVTRTLTVLLGGVAAISLLVGGIGVMNIMLVSVTERIREIGLRKALGASPRLVRRQFLVEASVLGLAGGLAGAALGVVLAALLPSAIGTSVVVSPTAVIGAVAVSIAIGVVFGVYPASRAARLTPIDALRSD